MTPESLKKTVARAARRADPARVAAFVKRMNWRRRLLKEEERKAFLSEDRELEAFYHTFARLYRVASDSASAVLKRRKRTSGR